MKIAIACDHGGLDYKNRLNTLLQEMGHEVKDFGTYSKDSCDYPDYIKPCAKAVANGEFDRGIIFCSTGIGVSITANKIKGIRCALVHDLMSARLTREHNDTNMLAMGQFIVSEKMMEEIVKIWLETPFSNGERHIRRINKIEE